MTVYARILSAAAIDRNPPRTATIDGRLVVGKLPEQYLNSRGWYRLSESPAPSTGHTGFHYEARYAYDSDETPTRIVQTWEEVADPEQPPRTFSKLKIVQALMAADLWTQVKAWIAAADLWDLYLAAQTFREDNPHFAPALTAMKQQLGVSDETAESILAASVAE